MKLSAKLLSKRFRGRNLQAKVLVGGTQLVLELPSDSILPKQGAKMLLSFDPRAAVQVFPRED
jgi:hypothetical protein